MGVVGVEVGVMGVTGEAGMGDIRPPRGMTAGAEEMVICSMHVPFGPSSASTLMSGGEARGLTRWG